LGFDSRYFWKLGQDENPHLGSWDTEEINFDPFWSATFRNLSMLRVAASFNHLTLLNDFDPTRLQEDGINLLAGSSFNYIDFSINYSSDLRKKFNGQIATNFGSFFNGTRYGSSGSITYRYQPYGFISMAYNYNRIVLDDPFVPVDIWLVGPRIDLTFSKQVFLTTFVQYNNQLDNLNINTRFQWRFAPASDLFIVYTDNYDTATLSNLLSRNRALVAKLTYWFNL